MLYVRFTFIISFLLLAAPSSYARNDAMMVPIADAMSMPDTQQKLGKSIKFYLGTQVSGRVAESFGDFVVSPKANAFNKTADRACEWDFLSALIALQEHAAAAGANAVINIVSFYDKHEVSNETAFECHKSVFVAGVALRGNFVRPVGR